MSLPSTRSAVTLWLACFCLTSLTASYAEQQPPTAPVRVTMANGNQLSGKSITSAKGTQLSVTSEHLQKPALLKTAQVLSVALNLPELEPITGQQVFVHCHPRFREQRGDAIRGKLLAITEEKITLKTTSVDSLDINRKFVSHTELLPNGEGNYFGPTSLDGWSHDSAWHFKSGSLVSTALGGIGRNVKLAPLSHVSFRAKFEKSLGFRLHLYSNDHENSNPAACYDINFRRTYAYLRTRGKADNGGGIARGGRWKALQLDPTQKELLLDIFTDRKKGTIQIFINGKSAATLQSVSPDPTNLGTGIRFLAEERYPLQISNIKVLHWDGKTLPSAHKLDVPHTATVVVDKAGKKHPFSSLKKEGADYVITAADEPDKTKRVPIKNTAQISIAQKDAEQPRKYINDVICHSHDGSRITLQLQSIQNGKLLGKSNILNQASFDLRAFSSIDFNPYNHELERIRQQNP